MSQQLFGRLEMGPKWSGRLELARNLAINGECQANHDAILLIT